MRLIVLLSFLISGCHKDQSPPQISFEQRAKQRAIGAFENLDSWILTTAKSDAPRGNGGIFLGNGFLGAGFGANGGSDATTKCFAAGVYNNEHLAALPLWNKLDYQVSGDNYKQSLDLKRGVLSTRLGAIEVTSFISLPRHDLAIIHVEGAPLPPQLPQIEIPKDWILLGATPISTHETLWNLRTTDGKTTLKMHVREVADGKQSWTRWVQIDTTNRVLDSALPGYQSALKEHEMAWAKRWKSDIQIEGDPEAQQLVRAMTFNLLCCVRDGASDSVPPEALIGDHYLGHIFWDAEIWMFPRLLAQHPNLAKTILDYRFNHLKQAQEIAKREGFAGIDFPWESASSGQEVAPPEFARERHITADVGWAHWQYWLWTYDKKWLRTRGWPVISGVADFWASRAKRNKAGKYDITQVVGPDENGGLVSNNTFTNAMAKSCLENAIAASRVLDMKTNARWQQVAQNLILPFDGKRQIYLKCDNDKGGTTKQADGELTIYPANLPMSSATTEKTFDFHRVRPIRSGPAMTTSLQTIIAARLGRQAQSETLFRESYRPFVRGPFLLFSEKRGMDRCVFVTGIGGVLQSVLYGFGDLRADDFGKAVARKIVLPKSWRSLTISGIKHDGKSYRLKITPTSRTLIQSNEP